MNKTHIIVLAIGLILVVGAFAGCIGEDDDDDENGENDNGEDDNGEDDNGEDDDDDGYVGSGTETYSGTWEGEDATGDEYDGTWEFTVDWENEDVSGWFYGDAEGDIEGSVSAGEIDAAGEAGLGYVTWEGTFTADGSSVSGNWEIEAQGLTTHSGTWTGEIGELENGNGDDDDDDDDDNDDDNDDENGLPGDDETEGDEPLDRYPDSVMLSHTETTVDGDKMIQISYGTEDTPDDVVNWYKEELGDPYSEQTQNGETILYYDLSEEEGQSTEHATITVSEDDYTSISIMYVAEN